MIVFALLGFTKWELAATLSLHDTRMGAELALYEWETRLAIQKVFSDEWGDRYTGDWVWKYDSYRVVTQKVERLSSWYDRYKEEGA